jgi:serine/threonine-protein kinase
MTTGQRCFHGATDLDRMLAVVRGEYVAPTAHVPDYPPALAEIIATALALDPAKRYPSAAAMIEALEHAARGEGWTCRAASIASVMQQLFPRRCEAALVDPPSVDPTVPDLTPVVPSPRTPRWPRGTGCEPYIEDEAPTRGRGPLQKWLAPHVAA